MFHKAFSFYDIIAAIEVVFQYAIVVIIECADITRVAVTVVDDLICFVFGFFVVTVQI